MTATPVNSKGTTADKDAMLKAPLHAVVVTELVTLMTWLFPASHTSLSALHMRPPAKHMQEIA